MPALKLGLIGRGRIVQTICLNGLKRLPDVELVTLREPDRQRREGASRRPPVLYCFH